MTSNTVWKVIGNIYFKDTGINIVIHIFFYNKKITSLPGVN